MTAKRFFISAVAALAPLALLGVGASASAATTPVATITVPNITVKSMQNVNVYGTLANPSVTGASGGGYWEMAQNVNSAIAGAWWLYKGHVTDSATGFTPGSDALGTYHAYPEGATDNSGKPIGQNKATFYIREASKTALKVTRSGSSLTILAGATYYNTKLAGGSMGAWVPYSGQQVTIYLWAGGKWKAWKSYTTGKNGNITAFTVQSAAQQKFYAATADGNIVWGNASPAVTK